MIGDEMSKIRSTMQMESVVTALRASFSKMVVQ